MKKSERLITALITIALGVLLIVLRGDLISILMTVVGLGLINQIIKHSNQHLLIKKDLLTYILL